MRTKGRRIAITTGLVAFVLLAIAVVLLTLPSLNHSTVIIDIGSGLRRTKAVRAGFGGWGPIEETRISRLQQKYIGARGEPVWREAIHEGGTFLARFSSYPAYHATIAYSELLCDLLERPAFTEEARAAAVRRFFKLLPQGGSDGLAREYVIQLREIADGAASGTIGSDRLPSDK